MVTFNLDQKTGTVGDRITYTASGLDTTKGFYITAIANYNFGMDDYSLAQLRQVIIGRKAYRGSGGISSSDGWVDITEDIYNLNVQTLTIIYFDNYGNFESLNDFEENVIVGEYAGKSEDYAVNFYNGKKLSGIVTWLRQWFNTKEEQDTLLFTDSGWQSCTISSGYAVYTSGTYLRVKKRGKIVEVTGVFKNNSALGTSSTTGIQFATLPSGYRPSKQQTKICQGTNMNRWLLVVSPDGKLTFSRYGATSYQSISASSWFPYTLTFMID